MADIKAVTKVKISLEFSVPGEFADRMTQVRETTQWRLNRCLSDIFSELEDEGIHLTDGRVDVS